jgi:hypothetical protein
MYNQLTDLSSYSDQTINHSISPNTNESELGKSIMHKRMLSKSENISTSLTIKTAEGDIVQLSTNSFYDFKSLLYNRKGQIYSNAGIITNQENYRQMTLTSGESFTFSVKGHLNAEELNDIEKIVKQIDHIIYDMKQGDMDNAIKKALNMGGYDTISGFSADLSVKQSYSMISQIQNKIADIEENLLKRIKEPVEQLFAHHFQDLSGKQDKRLDPINIFLEQLQQH